ncbi:hypothetical protein M427DRAFT_208666 [Gonapodya prolifera JEL478]|uniref:MFS general substrate transporter n=1 Tax=Gonapodya prolifera (strain JEL478) TaxID=1344416 RepID=A0A139ANN9_GONPJ|nr:hypothetical protein M427DRAFT_208666 [Gonapodya prolifera JEL478]|eukprot:KXS18352.1 hypothetical protein M427DRAFT_208666 [Gonapodya prolifera JEL478]
MLQGGPRNRHELRSGEPGDSAEGRTSGPRSLPKSPHGPLPPAQYVGPSRPPSSTMVPLPPNPPYSPPPPLTGSSPSTNSEPSSAVGTSPSVRPGSDGSAPTSSEEPTGPRRFIGSDGLPSSVQNKARRTVRFQSPVRSVPGSESGSGTLSSAESEEYEVDDDEWEVEDELGGGAESPMKDGDSDSDGTSNTSSSTSTTDLFFRDLGKPRQRSRSASSSSSTPSQIDIAIARATRSNTMANRFITPPAGALVRKHSRPTLRSKVPPRGVSSLVGGIGAQERQAQELSRLAAVTVEVSDVSAGLVGIGDTTGEAANIENEESSSRVLNRPMSYPAFTPSRTVFPSPDSRPTSLSSADGAQWDRFPLPIVPPSPIPDPLNLPGRSVTLGEVAPVLAAAPSLRPPDVAMIGMPATSQQTSRKHRPLPPVPPPSLQNQPLFPLPTRAPVPLPRPIPAPSRAKISLPLPTRSVVSPPRPTMAESEPTTTPSWQFTPSSAWANSPSTPPMQTRVSVPGAGNSGALIAGSSTTISNQSDPTVEADSDSSGWVDDESGATESLQETPSTELTNDESEADSLSTVRAPIRGVPLPAVQQELPVEQSSSHINVQATDLLPRASGRLLTDVEDVLADFSARLGDTTLSRPFTGRPRPSSQAVAAAGDRNIAEMSGAGLARRSMPSLSNQTDANIAPSQSDAGPQNIAPPTGSYYQSTPSKALGDFPRFGTPLRASSTPTPSTSSALQSRLGFANHSPGRSSSMHANIEAREDSTQMSTSSLGASMTGDESASYQTESTTVTSVSEESDSEVSTSYTGNSVDVSSDGSIRRYPLYDDSEKSEGYSETNTSSNQSIGQELKTKTTFGSSPYRSATTFRSSDTSSPGRYNTTGEEMSSSSSRSKISWRGVDEERPAKPHGDDHTSTKTSLYELYEGAIGWAIVFAAFLACGCTSAGLLTWGIQMRFFVATGVLPDLPNWVLAIPGSTGLSLVFGLSIPANKFAEAWGFRLSVLFGGILMGGALLLSSLASNYWQLLLTEGIMFGVGGAFGLFPAVALISQWIHPRRRLLAQGIAMSGFSVGPMVASPGIQLLSSWLGWNWTLRVFGIAVGVRGDAHCRVPSAKTKGSSSGNDFPQRLVVWKGLLFRSLAWGVHWILWTLRSMV